MGVFTISGGSLEHGPPLVLPAMQWGGCLFIVTSIISNIVYASRYMLQDWSGSILSSMCPVATRSATTRQNSNVNECTWDGNSILKVCGCVSTCVSGRSF